MKLLLLAAAMAVFAGPPAAQPAPGRLDVSQAPGDTVIHPGPSPWMSTPVVGDEYLPGCQSYRRQIAEVNKRREDRLANGWTLDREPAGHAFLAVDRRMDGCRVLTFLHGQAAVPVPGRGKPRP